MKFKIFVVQLLLLLLGVTFASPGYGGPGQIFLKGPFDDDDDTIDPCDPNPCLQASACHPHGSTYSCYCYPHYGGKNCTVKLVGCSGSPCKFDGHCVENYDEMNDIHSFSCQCKPGYEGKTCEVSTTMGFNGTSFAEIMNEDASMSKYHLTFLFKTIFPDTVLAIGKGSEYFYLGLSEGKLLLESSLIQNLGKFTSGSDLNNGRWHKALLAFNKTHVTLGACTEQVTLPITEEQSGTATGFGLTILGGANPDNSQFIKDNAVNYVGCIQNIKVNGELINTKQTDKVKLTNVFNYCERHEMCRKNPCRNGGTCVDLWTDYRCDCPRPYVGDTCEVAYTPTTFNYEAKKNSLATIDLPSDRSFGNRWNISMFLRTRTQMGTIFLFCDKAKGLSGGYVEGAIRKGNLQVAWENGEESKFYKTEDANISDGETHFVEVMKDEEFFTIRIDKVEHVRVLKRSKEEDLFNATALFVGGWPNYLYSGNKEITGEVLVNKANKFKGTIQDLRVGLGEDLEEFVVVFFNSTEDGREKQKGNELGKVTVQNLKQGGPTDDDWGMDRLAF